MSSNNLPSAAEAFVEMAHRIVWCSVATVDVEGRPRSRILHPIWEWNGESLEGWVGTRPTPIKREHLRAHPYMSLNYWQSDQDTCVAECRATWAFDEDTKTAVWDKFKAAPEPLGYDPSTIWESADHENFAVIKLEPWRLRVYPGSLLAKGEGEQLTWEED